MMARRKRKVILTILLTLFLAFLFIPSGYLLAKAESKDWEAQLNDVIFEQLNVLELGELEDYVNSLGTFDEMSIRERLFSFINDGGLNYDSFFQGLTDVLFNKVKQLLPAFACVASIALLCGVLQTLQSHFLGESTAKIIFFVAYLGALIPILGILTECIITTTKAVGELKTQMDIIFPLILTLIAASGGSVSVAIYKPSVAFLSNVLVKIVESIIFPITVVMIVFSMVNKFFGELKVDKFIGFFKSINKWVLGIGISVFGLFFTVQGITAASYDGIARRAAKYAIGTGIPIIGGFLSGGFDLAIAGSVLIKNSIGNFSLVLLVFSILEPLMLLIASNVLFKLTAAVTQPFGESKISSFMEETADAINYFVAGLLFTAFLYFIVILLLTCSMEMLL